MTAAIQMAKLLALVSVTILCVESGKITLEVK